MKEKFLKPYNPAETEARIYERWLQSGFFDPDVCIEKGITKKNAPYFSIVLPPPNVTGMLHTGHAAMLAIEDIMVRYSRMRGLRTLWIPGTDHAAIATQSKVEGQLIKEEGKTRHDLGREEFLRRIEVFTRESHDTIITQVKRMGASLDWSREAYTLDTKRERAVRIAFQKMYDEDLIYQGERIVNWDPKMQTTVSDDEIEWLEEKTPLYYLRYGPFTITTARPETKFGDKYVVVHPADQRYLTWNHREKIVLEWINGPITATVIKDETIDQEFGTGAMTITPWHDSADFEIAERHSLDKEQIIDFRGVLLPIAGEFAGEHIKKARPRIIEKLKTKGLIKRVDETYIHRLPTNARSSGIIEPQIKTQWFVAVNKEFVIQHSTISTIPSGSVTTFKNLMRAAVEGGDVAIIPEYFSKTYFHWIDNLRDWCISRQIWYGHRIPVWYCSKCAEKENDYVEVTQNYDRKMVPVDKKNLEPIVSVDIPNECPRCGANSKYLLQDPDTLDTWFSSGLWTFSTLGWPEQTQAKQGKTGPENDFANYHPTSALETGYDILFFWVARMILMTGFLLGDVPFRKVYLHGLVRDERGRKMSKSLGNIVDPVSLIDKYGADAVRMALIIGTTPGTDMKLSEEKVRGYKHFANKLWNIARFVLEHTNDYDGTEPELTAENASMLRICERLLADVTADIEAFRFYLAGEKLYHYIWHTLADVVIEESKKVLLGNENQERREMQFVLSTILTNCLKALHPFMPFVTEEIWQQCGTFAKKKAEFLMVEKWPRV